MRDPHAVEAVGAGGPHARAGGLVKADRHVQRLAGSPQRIVIGVVPGPVVIEVGAQENRLHAELADGAAHFGDGARDLMRRNRGGAIEPVRIGGRDIVMQPVVVGAARGGGKARVHVRERRHIHAEVG